MRNNPNQKFSCLIVGTGFSGLAMAISLKKRGINDFLLVEKSSEIGGTWRDNTYPGAECDIPSALYSYSFEPYPDWEYKWSMQGQILHYIKHVAQKYDLYPHIQFNTEINEASWDDNSGFWNVLTKNGTTLTVRTLITAIGQLHHPRLPNIEGRELFQGLSFHSAQWNHDVELDGKTVGVIGNAASAVQFIPQIAKRAGKVIVFQRSANWMLPKQDRAYKNWEKKLVKQIPVLLQLYRLRLWLLGGGLFFLMKQGNHLLRKFYQRKSIQYIKKNIKDPLLIQALTPTYPMGAKRVLFSDDYYAALARPNVHLETAKIRTVTKSGIETEKGDQRNVEVLIYATGFITNPFLKELEITGRNRLILSDHWKNGPVNYHGVTVDQFPNFFMMYGPNTNLGHNSIIIMSEAQAEYIGQCVEKMVNQNVHSIEVKKESITKYYSKTQERLKKMIWATIDDSWYKSKQGLIPNNYPGRTMEYMRIMKSVNWNDFDIVVRGSE